VLPSVLLFATTVTRIPFRWSYYKLTLKIFTAMIQCEISAAITNCKFPTQRYEMYRQACDTKTALNNKIGVIIDAM
jgi:hypothetical protein